MKKFIVALFFGLSVSGAVFSQSTSQETFLFPIRDSFTGLYGFIDSDGKTVIEPSFDDVSPFSEGLAWVRNRGKSYFIDKTGKKESLEYDSESFCKLNSIGQVLCGATFNEGLARYSGIESNWFWSENVFGFLALDGEKVKSGLLNAEGSKKKFEFLDAEDFSEGLAAVSIQTSNGSIKWGYIDRSGSFIIPPKFDRVYSFSEERALVIDGMRQGYIDRTGNFVTDENIEKRYEFSFGNRFSNGMAVVNIGTKFGFIDRQGRVVIEPTEFEFDEAAIFTDCGESDDSVCLARVKVGGKFGFINKNGEYVIEPQFDFARSFEGGLAVASNEKVDAKTLATTKIEYLSGYINGKGEFVIRPQYLIANDFKNGVALVRNNYVSDSEEGTVETLDHTASYIDSQGKIIATWSECRFYKCAEIEIRPLESPMLFGGWKAINGSSRAVRFVLPPSREIPVFLTSIPTERVRYYVIRVEDWDDAEREQVFPEEWVKLKRKDGKSRRNIKIDFIDDGLVPNNNQASALPRIKGRLVFTFDGRRCPINNKTIDPKDQWIKKPQIYHVDFSQADPICDKSG